MKHYALALVAAALSLQAEALTLPSIFSENMVLEQNSEIEIWGWGKPKEPVRVTCSWSNELVTTEVLPDATWRVRFSTTAGSYNPETIVVEGYNRLEISNIMIGEVILCSGQSNMEWSVGAGIEGRDELVAKSDRPGIRMFTADYRTADAPTHDVTGKWQVASQQTINSFSAIGYVVATRIEDELQVPVGVVNSSWGGTPIECWSPAIAYEMCDYLRSANDELKLGQWGPCRPGKIYNAMIAPMKGYRFACLVWYQGEENTNNPKAYTDMLYTFVNGYRELFGAKLPMVYAQIAPYNYGNGKGVEIRERQRRAMSIPGSAMVVIGDLGDKENIHPQKKIEAGDRLANAVLSLAYKREKPYKAPLFSAMEIDKKKVIITFDNADGLCVKGAKTPDNFEICGVDKVFYPATATLKNGKVELTSKKVKTPVAARYAWADDAMPNLYNSDGIQASCFTTEDEF